MTEAQAKALGELTSTGSALCGLVMGLSGDLYQEEIDAFRAARTAVYDEFAEGFAGTYMGRRPNLRLVDDG